MTNWSQITATERRAGEILKEMPSAQGKRTDLVTACYDVSAPPTLSDLEISRIQSSRWQAMADVPRRAGELLKERDMNSGQIPVVVNCHRRR